MSRILEVLERERRSEGDNAFEDLWLSTRLNALPGARLPNATVSKTFSVESVWDETPLGYHIGWLGVHHEQVRFFIPHFYRPCLPILNRSGMIKPR